MPFDYYYRDESEQFSFFRIPRLLITSPQFARLSTDAKLLYGLFLDRMSLSARNGWLDEQGRVYIYYTLDEIQSELCCGHDKAVKLLAELDTPRGVGLIERVKQGQGKPTKIFVKRFAEGREQDFGKVEIQTSENRKSALRENRTQDFGKSDASYTYKNQTETVTLNPSIDPADDWRDRRECVRFISESVERDELAKRFGNEDVDGVIELIADTLCSTRDMFRIGGEDVPIQQVKSRFFALERSHMEHLFEGLRSTDKPIRNVRAYLLTALYNAPITTHYG